MPRKSLRQKTLDIVKAHVSRLKKAFLLRFMMNVNNSIEDDNYLSKKKDCMIWNLLVTYLEPNIERTGEFST